MSVYEMYYIHMANFHNEFILNEILKDNQFDYKLVKYSCYVDTVNKKYTGDLFDFKYWQKIMKSYKNIVNNNIFYLHVDKWLIYNTNKDVYNKFLRKLCKHMKPKILIFGGDENFIQPEICELAKYCDTFISLCNSECNYLPNTIVSPIGYSHGFDNNLTFIKPITQRSKKWCFIENTETGISEIMIKNMKKLEDENNIISCDNSDIKKHYTEAIFIPICRQNLKCSEIDEALICGAIPVIVSQEYDEYKKHLHISEILTKPNNNLPYIYAETWERIYEKCQYLLSNEDKLLQLQKENIIWYTNTINNYRQIVNKAFLID